MTPCTQSDLTAWPETFMAAHPPRSKSVVMTLFGDVILPHGGALWLGSLIRLLAPFGISDRLVRTSVYRLAEEGWLSANRQGRRSMYTLRESASGKFEHAYKRIYKPTYLTWDGQWTQVMLLSHMLAADERAALRKELLWEGFGALSPTSFIHPNPDQSQLNDLLAQLNLRNRLFIGTLKPASTLSSQPFSELIDHCWDLESVAAGYQRFLDWFGPLRETVPNHPDLDPELAFVLRTLLIHEFRRTQLHDPLLPLELLPINWAGKQAYELCRDLYRLLFKKANEHILSVLRVEDEHAQPVEDYFYERFGGLAP